jgi:hypothetical protein
LNFRKKFNCILKYGSLIMTKVVLVIDFFVYERIDVFEHSQKEKWTLIFLIL